MADNESDKAKEGTDSCCSAKKKSGVEHGIAFGLLPHAGCIAVILLSVFSVTAGTTLLVPFLQTGVFYWLIALSLAIATASAVWYLRKRQCLCKAGIKQERKYLATLYGTTITVNLVLLFVVFPAVGGFAATTGFLIAPTPKMVNLTILCDIPCPGHAPLITDDVANLTGVVKIDFSSPNVFSIVYDPTKTSQNAILSREIFDQYPATILSSQQL